MSNSEFDTGRQHLANVYAKALLGAAQSAGQLDHVLSELGDLVTQVFDRSPGLEEVLASPRIDEGERTAILDRALAGKVSDVLLNFLKVMARHGRLDCIRATHQAAQHWYNVLRGRREVFVRTAAPITAETADLIASRLRGKLNAEVDLRLEVDPSLIGGLIVRVGDTVFDGSVANQLNRFRDEAAEKAAHEMRATLNRFLAPA